MARYSATTAATQIANVDVVQVAARIAASAKVASAFLPVVDSFKAPSRQGILTQRGTHTWAALNMDTSAGTEPDETQYTPTSVTYTCTGHYADAVLGQYALQDAETSNESLEDQIVRAGVTAYVSYIDGLFAALYDDRPTSNPDHLIGTSADIINAGLIDTAISLLLAAGAPTPYAAVIYTARIPDLMAIPGMRDKAIVGGRSGGVGGPNLGIANKKIIEGYGGVLDVYHSDQIKSSSGYHNMMFSVGMAPEEHAIANPWVDMITPNGRTGQKMFVDTYWDQNRRCIQVNMTTVETMLNRVFTNTTNKWLVDFTTA